MGGGSTGGKGAPSYTLEPIPEPVPDPAEDEESRLRLERARRREEQRRRSAARATLSGGASGVAGRADIKKHTLG